jgi:hypothetical protein
LHSPILEHSRIFFKRRLRMKSRMAGLLLVSAVLLAHFFGLSWLHDQLPAFRPMVLMAQPLFTRTITPAPVPMTQARPSRTRTHSGNAPPREMPEVVTETQALPQAEAQATPEQPASDVPPAQTQRVPDNEPTAAEAPSTTASTDSWPADTRLSYRLTGYYRGDLYGSARVQWQREQSRYQVRVDLSMALVVRLAMISQGEVTDTGLLPSAYEEQFPGGVQRMVFDGGYVRFQDGSQLLQPQALQDTASQFVDLSHRFSTGRDALKVGSEVRMWLARPQGMALWTYDVIEEDTLQLPEMGPVSAFHLRPRPIANPRGTITAEIWFAPSLQYLPVRVRISLGAGNFVDLMVERIEQGGVAANTPGTQPLRQ